MIATLRGMVENMNCSKCGMPLEDGVKFCGSCGDVAKGEQTIKLNTLNYQKSVEPQEPPNNEHLNSIVEQPENEKDSSTALFAEVEKENSSEIYAGNESLVIGESVFEPLDEQSFSNISSNNIPVRGNNKKLITALACLIAILVIGCLCFVFYPQIVMGIMSPQEYYLMQETKAMNEMKATFNYDELFKDTPPVAVDGDMSITIDAAPEIIPPEIAALFSKINLKFNMNDDVSKGLNKSTLELVMDNSVVVNSLIEMQNNKLAMSFPGLIDGKYVTTVNDGFNKLMRGDENEYIAMTGMNTEQLKNVFELLYKDVVIKAFPKENVTEGSGSFDGKNCKTAAFLVDETSCKAMLAALSEHLKVNKKILLPILQKAVTYFEVNMDETILEIFTVQGMPPITPSEIEAEYDKLVSDLLKSSGTISMSNAVTYKVYYDSRGQLVAREITESDDSAKLTFSTVKESGELISAFNIDFEGQNVNITNRHKIDQNAFAGSLAVNMNTPGVGSGQLASMNYNFDLSKKFAGVTLPIGEYTVNLNDDAFNSGFSFNMLFKNEAVAADSTKLTTSFNMGVDGQEIKLGFVMNSKYNSLPNFDGIDIPSETTIDEEEMASALEIITERAVKALGLEDLIGAAWSPYNLNPVDYGSELGNIDVNSYGFVKSFDNVDALMEHIMMYDFETNPDNLSDDQINTITDLLYKYIESLSV